jgi:sulfur-carrier protein
MLLNIEFHGLLRQIVGRPELQLQLPKGTVEDVLHRLCELQPQLAAHLPGVACAMGSEIVARTYVLADGDTLALIPPVSGGAG